MIQGTLQALQMRRMMRDEEGATAVEYGLLVALIAAVIVGTVLILGGQIDAAFQTIVDALPGGGGGDPVDG